MIEPRRVHIYPVLFRIGSFEITSFGALVALGALAGLWMFRRELHRSGLPESGIDAAMAGLLGGLAGAKLLWVFEHFGEEPLQDLVFSRGGLSWFGGFAGGVLAGLWVMHRKRLPRLAVLAAATPGLALGHAIGRIGCFLVGDDYGRPTHAPVGRGVPRRPASDERPCAPDATLRGRRSDACALPAASIPKAGEIGHDGPWRLSRSRWRHPVRNRVHPRGPPCARRPVRGTPRITCRRRHGRAPPCALTRCPQTNPIAMTPTALILDFGEVLTNPQPRRIVERMAAIARLPLEQFVTRYWAHRPEYDGGMAATEYLAAGARRPRRPATVGRPGSH